MLYFEHDLSHCLLMRGDTDSDFASLGTALLIRYE